MAGNTDDIEREIMLEMEKEIQRTQAQSSNNNGSSNAAGSTTTTALHQDAAATLASNAVQHALTSSHMTEEEQIQAEIEERLRRKREARREAEEHARREAEQQARREAEQQARREAEEQARREAEQQARREAEQQARREAEQQARREAEEHARREAEQQARREAEQQARREAEQQQARREAEQQARREAEQQARREAEQQQARREAEEHARREAEEQARREAEQQARREAEEHARREAEQQARREAEQQARREAEQQARREAEQQQARREAEQQARREAEEQARREAEQQARREAEEQARREAEQQQARREAEQQARREAEEQARREAHEAALEEIRRKAREEVFAAYAAKSRQASLAASPLTGGAEQQAVAAVNAATSTSALTSTTSSFAHAAATTTTTARTRDEHVDKASEGSHGGARRHYRSAYDDDSNDGDDTDITSDEDDDDAASHSDAESSGYSADALAALRNDNGLCARTEQDSSVDDSDFVDAPLASFEAVRQRECARRARSPAAQQQQQQQQQDDMHTGDDDDDDAVGVDCVDVHRYGTIREPGRCLFPPDEVRGTVPAHAKVQLGFFRARQLILSRATHLRHRRVADRERVSEGDERALSTLTCYFEHELLQDRDLTVDDEDCAHNAPREQLLRRDDVQHDGEAAIRKAVSSISYGDPIQVWERVCHGGSATTTTTSDGNNSSNNSGDDVTGEHMWVSGIDTRKPVPAMRTFTGGRVVRVVAQKLASGVVREHGEGSDPLVVALAFYSLADNANMKVSETFYFDAAVDVFYPHKQRSELARENVAVAFIPAEFMPSLYLVARVYRPCSDDFDSFVDLYTRPERYKASHVAPMKQETLLLARESDVLEELGWFAVPCVSNDTAKTLQPRLTIAQLYRKPLNDVDLLRLAPDARTRGTLRTVPIDVHLTLQDVSAHEVAFPSAHADPLPTENETLVSLLDPDVPGARARVYRYAPCCIPILNSGYFTAYTNVYYLRLRVMRVIVTGALRSALPSSMSSHRTFALHLCVKERDDSLSEDDGAVLRCIYGRGLGALTLDTHAWSSSVSGASEFALSDEYKLQLPLNLTDRHHVFFTLYALCPRHGSGSVGSGSGSVGSSSSNGSSSYRVGYAALPLLVDGAVHVRDHIDLRFVAHEHAAVAAAGGYLASFAKAPASAFLNNGDVALTLATQARTSVHASNRVIASVFRLCPPSLDVLRRDDDVLARSGELTRLAAAAPPPPPPPPSAAAAAAAAASSSATPYDPHRVVITYISQLPLAEVLAFYPFLSAYAFALIGSGAGNVTLASRTHMLDVLLLITTKAQQYDTNASTIRRRHGSVAVADVFTRTSVASVLYHFFSNNVLYDSVDDNNNNSRGGGRFRVYAGLVETWLNLLRVTAAQATSDAAAMTTTTTAAAAAATTSSNNSMTSKPSTATTAASARNLNREMSDLSWFLFDAILRSVYLWCDEHGGARSARFDVSFYSHVAELCVTVLRQLSTYDESTLVRRVAVFVRNLMHCCDRGHMLAVCERVLRYLDEQSNYESMTNFLRYVLADHALVAALLRPCTRARQPVFLTRLLVGSFATLLTHSGSSHTARSLACDVLYGFVRRLADDAAFTSAALTSVATQLFPLVRSVSMQWRALPPVSATASYSHNNNGDADNKAAVPTTAAAAALAERRQLAMALLWVLYYTPSAHTRQWLRGEADAKAIVGVMHMVTNAQSLFRYTAGHDKAADGSNDGATTRTGGRVADGGATAATATANNNNTNMLTSANAASNRSTASLTTATMTSAADNNNNISTMTLAAPSSSVVVDASAQRAWDGRHATLVTAMGTQLGSLVLHTLTTVLRTVKEDKASVCVFPFFTLLESVLHLGNSTASLQMSAALLHATVCQLFPEIISRKAAMSSGMVLLTFRLMSSCCQYVRSSASWTFLLMCQAYFTWTRSLSKMKSLTANALVSVAESKTRDLRLAGRFIEFQFDDLVDAAAVEEANYVTPSAGFASRFEDDTHAASGDTLMRYKHDVEALPLSVQPVVPISRYLLDAPQPGTRSRSPRDGHDTSSSNSNKNDNNDDDARHGSATPRFSDDFAAMTRTVLSLFNDVLLLQVDSSLQFKEAKVFAYFDVFRNFLRQNALKESLRWLYRLHDAHKANEDMVEAGMVLVFIAALCFRVTEVFYRVKGRHSRGARMPYGVLTRVFWHDYVRILPELEALLPADTVHAIVSELYVCPDDACFTMEGQVRTLKEAAEYQDKGQYYEFSLATIGIVNVYLDALHDYKSAAVVHAAMHTWCSAIAEHTPRTSNRYFLLWARMERAESSSSSSWSSSSRASPSTSRKQASSTTWSSSSPASSKHHTTSTAAASSSAAAAASPLAVDDGMVGERPRGLPGGAAVRRVYKLPATTRLREFAAYARAYVVSLFDDDDALVIATDEPTETLPALPEPDSKRKRVAAVHRAPNHCLLTVYEVQPRYGVASASDDKSSSSSNNNSNSATTTTTMAAESGEGDDKTRHVRVFEYVHHAGLDVAAPTTATTTAAAAAVAAARSFDVMAYRLSISTYELDRAFPSTTTAIDVAATRQTTLNAYETAVEVLNTRRECIDDATAAARSGSASEAGELIVRVKEALCVRGLLPGVYMKEVVLAMSSQPDVDAALRALCASVRAALVVCDAHDAASAHPEAYALVLKAITDVECCLIATEATTTAATAADRSNNDTPRRH